MSKIEDSLKCIQILRDYDEWLKNNSLPVSRKINRDKSKEPRLRGASWCNGCDMAVVETGTKCPVCGYFSGGKRRHKRV